MAAPSLTSPTLTGPGPRAPLSAPDEARRVDEQLQTCAQCRRDLEWEHGMRAETSAWADPVPQGLDMDSALARLMPALGPQEHAVDENAAAPAGDADAARLPWWRTAAANQPSWLRWAVAAQWVLIVGLVALLVRPEQEPSAYHALGSGAAAGANLVVAFQPNTSEQDLRRILQAHNARVVDGPTVTDAYLITVPAAQRMQALQALRAESAVKLAEPLDSGAAP